MAEVQTAPARPAREPRNGVNTPALFATINAVKETPALAKFRFRASNRWLSGTFSESRVESFDGAGGTHDHQTQFRYAADHPAVLVGEDRGPTPIEFLLHGLAGCLTAGIGNIAAARGITLRAVTSHVEGDIDLRGILGLSNEVRNGYESIRITVRYRRGCAGREASGNRGAVGRTVGRVRRAHQRHADRHQRQRRLSAMATKFDAVIVGARCAGAATALLLARAGARVLVVDKGVFGSDTLVYARVDARRGAAAPSMGRASRCGRRGNTSSSFDDIRLRRRGNHRRDRAAVRRRTPCTRHAARSRSDSRRRGSSERRRVRLRRPRRRCLDRRAGACARRRRRPPRTHRRRHRRRRRRTVFDHRATGRARAGARRTACGRRPLQLLGGSARPTGIYWGFRPAATSGSFRPTTARAACSSACRRIGLRRGQRRSVGRVSPHDSRTRVPALDARLAGARQVEPIRGFGGHPGFIRKSTGPGWALVGDAVYFKDPATAHGITDALRDAELLTAAIVRGTTAAFATYESTRLDLSRTLLQITDEIVSFTSLDADLKALHRALSQEMAREVRTAAAWDPPAPLAPPTASLSA